MNIIQMKQEIKDIRAELAAEIDKGMEMAKNRATTLESIKAQSDKVDDLQIREALLMQALNTARFKAISAFFSVFLALTASSFRVSRSS